MDIRRGSAIMAVAAILTVVSTAGHAASFQKRTGYVVVPLPYKVSAVYVEGCPGFFDAVTNSAARIHLQPRFAVDPGTWGRHFTLKGFLQKSNLDISFRIGSQWVWVQYSSPGFKGETGWVPTGATEAAVCLRAGLPTRFVYVAG